MWTAGTPQLHRQPFTAAPPMLRAPCVYCRQQKGHVRQPAGPGPSAAAASPPPPTAAAATRTTSAFAAGAAALVLSLAAAAGAGPGIAAEAPPALTPYQEAKRLVLGPTADGSIRSCPTNINPNCVSTASTNDTYAPVWRAEEGSPAAAAEVLEVAVAEALPDAQLAKVAHLPTGEYRVWTVDSLFGQDVVEFVIKPDGVTDRNWEGDRPGVMVTYRSMAGSVKYVWPIQQPLSDFGAQRKRMDVIRAATGWQLIGCELLECYTFQ